MASDLELLHLAGFSLLGYALPYRCPPPPIISLSFVTFKITFLHEDPKLEQQQAHKQSKITAAAFLANNMCRKVKKSINRSVIQY